MGTCWRLASRWSRSLLQHGCCEHWNSLILYIHTTHAVPYPWRLTICCAPRRPAPWTDVGSVKWPDWIEAEAEAEDALLCYVCG